VSAEQRGQRVARFGHSASPLLEEPIADTYQHAVRIGISVGSAGGR